jgi:mannose-6-phosphate isomerase-like protein (cupin superfamily)
MMERRFWVRSLSSELAADATSPWTIRGLIEKYPGAMGRMSAFHMALVAGHQPHPIQVHDEEELLINLSGELELLTPERTHRMGPGGFAFLPPGDPHMARAVGPEFAVFLVLKWTWQNPQARPVARTLVLHGHEFDRVTDQGGIYRRRMCEDQPLANGGRLVVEAIRMMPRTGFPVHVHDDHDLMLVLLRGQMHGLGHVTSAPAVIYYSAKTPHGLEPLNPDVVEMIAFEFHSREESST